MAEYAFRECLRQARYDLALCGEIGDEARRVLEGEGAVITGLVADQDGDAPDRFDEDQPLDWSWVPKRGRGTKLTVPCDFELLC